MESVAGQERRAFGSISARSPDRVFRWAGVLLIAGGALGILCKLFYVLLMDLSISASAATFEVYAWLFDMCIFLLEPAGQLLVAVGLVGVYALVAAARPGMLLRWIAGTGTLLACSGTFVSLGMNQYELWAMRGGLVDSPAEEPVLFDNVLFWLAWAGAVGIVLLGVGALRVQGLGKWRALPLLLGLASLPPVAFLVFFALSGGGGPNAVVEGALPGALLDLPPLLVSAGWILLGFLLPHARRRDPAVVAARNLEAARQLYEEAWGRGKLGVLDALVAPGVADHHSGARGVEGLRRTVAGLRAAFPDLRFEIEAQSAAEDTVTTRWTASGTDLGGVLWYPPTGRPATFSGVYTDRFAGGRVEEHWGGPDTEDLLKQLGLPTSRG